MRNEAVVVGGGLAGVEAAWQIARGGFRVTLYEMRPVASTPAHTTGYLAELVCSNSFKSEEPGTAQALLKEEMRALGSLVLKVAASVKVEAGTALAVDRTAFAAAVTAATEAVPNLQIIREEIKSLPLPPAVIATGPLTSQDLADELAAFVGRPNLFFYDALAPIVAAESINWDETFAASRYGKGVGGYVNCPLSPEVYRAFVAALVEAETAPLKDFERGLFFEGCLPVEELARRGEDALRFGPLKPTGLKDPRTGKRPYAVLQLRAENAEATMFGLVGCQTRLKQHEQRRVFRLIPALSEARFLRYGAAHRNTYICAPVALAPTLEFKARPGLFAAGQIAGGEGYMEAAATGILAGMNLRRVLAGKAPVYPPADTALGALVHYLTTTPPSLFGPMNVNFGLFPPVAGRSRDKRRVALLARARASFARWLEEIDERANG